MLWSKLNHVSKNDPRYQFAASISTFHSFLLKLNDESGCSYFCILCNLKQLHLNTLKEYSQKPCRRVPWNSMEYSMEFHGTLLSFEMTPSMEFNGTKLYLIWQHQSSMEFHGIPWNPVSFEMAPSLFQGIPRNSVMLDLSKQEFHGIPWNIPYNSQEDPDVNLNGIFQFQFNFTEVQGNLVSIEITISKFHWIPWNSVVIDLAAPEFHGIPWNLVI